MLAVSTTKWSEQRPAIYTPIVPPSSCDVSLNRLSKLLNSDLRASRLLLLHDCPPDDNRSSCFRSLRESGLRTGYRRAEPVSSPPLQCPQCKFFLARCRGRHETEVVLARSSAAWKCAAVAASASCHAFASAADSSNALRIHANNNLNTCVLLITRILLTTERPAWCYPQPIIFSLYCTDPVSRGASFEETLCSVNTSSPWTCTSPMIFTTLPL